MAIAHHRLLDLQRGVLRHRQPAQTAAQIAAPRAWPSSSVDSGLTLTNTFSTATWSGACSAITSLRLSRITFRRSGSAIPEVRTTPLPT
jgi:hypothetical protein